MKKPLSFSGYEKYHQCPKKYDLHYNHKIRPDSLSNHLLFGSATDKALNEILLGKTDADAIKAAQVELARLFTETVNVESSDFDSELLSEETLELLVQKLKDAGWTGSNPSVLAQSLFEKRSFGGELTPDQTKMLNILVYFSWLEKIQLIIQGFRDYVEPQIEEIVSVQTYVKRGILDFTVKLKGVDGIIIGDNKTAGKDYDDSAVRTSVQIASYGASKGAYIVFNKTVRKNRTKVCSVCGNNGTGKRHKTCDAQVEAWPDGPYDRCNGEWTETISPEIVPQIIVDDISEHTRTMVETAFQDTETLIDSGVFPRNLSTCSKQFGRKCDYYDYCWNNGDMKGLVKKDGK
jgi:hypothetical protein